MALKDSTEKLCAHSIYSLVSPIFFFSISCVLRENRNSPRFAVSRNNNLILSIANCNDCSTAERFQRSYRRLIPNNWKLESDRVCACAGSARTAVSRKISFLENLVVACACVRYCLRDRY